MSKIKKAPIHRYGILITKPFSTLMYNHNENCAREMKFNIRDAWANEMIKFNKTDEWPSESKSTMHTIQRSICATGFGDGFTIDEVNIDFLRNLSDMADWQLHEEYSYLCFGRLVPRTHFMMVGFEWEKMDYDYTNTNEISAAVSAANERAFPTDDDCQRPNEDCECESQADCDCIDIKI